MDDGNEVIPFSAMRELYKYEAFVTNIAPQTKIDDIKMHLKKKLCTDNIFLKIMTKTDAPLISFGVLVKSERDTLNLMVPGLWPIGTRIYKWNSKAGDRRVVNPTSGTQGRPATGGLRGNNSNATQNRAARPYRYPCPDQQRLHNQNG